MTAGFDVFVHEVIAAMTTDPWSRTTVSPSISQDTPWARSATADGTATTWPPVGAIAPGSAVAGGSLAGKDSATASSTEFP